MSETLLLLLAVGLVWCIVNLDRKNKRLTRLETGIKNLGMAMSLHASMTRAFMKATDEYCIASNRRMDVLDELSDSLLKTQELFLEELRKGPQAPGGVAAPREGDPGKESTETVPPSGSTARAVVGQSRNDS